MQTVSEYYSLLDKSEGLGNLEIFFMGYFPDSAVRQLEQWKKWPALFEEAYAVIEELKEQPFNGPPMAHIIVDMAQKRFRKKTGMPVPRCWFFSMARLKEQPEDLVA
jgi:hypothetical protein